MSVHDDKAKRPAEGDSPAGAPHGHRRTPGKHTLTGTLPAAPDGGADRLAELAVHPGLLEFPTTLVGEASEPRPVEVVNRDDHPIAIDDSAIDGASRMTRSAR